MNIDEMPAGREMDALVAEKVMGYKKSRLLEKTVNDYRLENQKGNLELPPRYSTDIAAAWEVVEKIRGMYVYCALELASHADKIITFNINHYSADYTGLADTAPLAICRAALKAVDRD